MTKAAFDKIAAGLNEALARARGGCVFCEAGFRPHDDGMHRSLGHEVRCFAGALSSEPDANGRRTTRLVKFQPPQPDSTVRCRYCHQDVSETRCDDETHKNCFCFVTRKYTDPRYGARDYPL
jgi:hypothetical protein